MPVDPITLSNRYLTARFSAATGLLTHLSKPRSKQSLIRFCQFSYFNLNDQMFTGLGVQPDPDLQCVAIENVSVHHETNRVVMQATSQHLRLTAVWTLPESSPTLRVDMTVRSRSVPGKLKHVALPRIAFDDSFNNVFEDERDLYDDGLELAAGQELPCWRVFSRQGHRDGLWIVTRSKRDMARFNILERGFDIAPHTSLNYTTNVDQDRSPLDTARSTAYRASFEIGPWSRKQHVSLVDAAELDQPVTVACKKPAGSPPRVRRGRVIALHESAEKSAIGPAENRNTWTLATMPWASQGKALFASTGVAPPAITIQPAADGPHHVYLGVGDSAGATLKVSGDPETRYRLTDGARISPVSPTFDLALSGRHRAHELDFGVIDLTDKTLQIGRFPDLHRPSTLDYLRLVPLTPRQIKQWHQRDANKPALALSGLADIPDLSIIMDARNPDPSVFAASIWAHAQQHLRQCFWRIDGQCSDYPSGVNTMRYPSAKVHGVFSPRSKAYGRALQQIDVLQTAVDAAKRYGVSLWGWMRFNSYAGNVVSDFYKNNPRYHQQNERGDNSAQLCLAFNAVRQHKIDILVEACRYGLDGICLGFLRTPPIVQYHPIMQRAYRKRFGIDPPRDRQFSDPTHSKSIPQRANQDEYDQWWQFRAQYLTRFGRELRTALRQADLGHIKIALWLRPNHCLFDGIDLDVWLDEKLCDQVVAMSPSARHDDASIWWGSRTWRKHVQRHVPLIRAIVPHLSKSALEQRVRRVIDAGYDGLCTYESNDTVLNPRYIQMYEKLRHTKA